MKRWNAQLRKWERKQGDAWVAEDSGGALDDALGAAFSEAQGSGVAAQAVAQSGSQAEIAAVAAAVDSPADPAGPAGSVDWPGDSDNGSESGSAVDFDIPGLVSAEGPRSTAGTRSVRERLTKLAQRGKTAERAGKRVSVGPRAAQPSGPAVLEGTAARQTRKKVAAQESPHQRYVNRPAPGLLSSRPRWVQDLFEAHFRSDMTLQLRREHNRMKISRQDYAIGWLTLLDKIREEPSIARLRENGQG